jgi:hypothetical protein
MILLAVFATMWRRGRRRQLGALCPIYFGVLSHRWYGRPRRHAAALGRARHCLALGAHHLDVVKHRLPSRVNHSGLMLSAFEVSPCSPSTTRPTREVRLSGGPGDHRASAVTRLLAHLREGTALARGGLTHFLGPLGSRHIRRARGFVYSRAPAARSAVSLRHSRQVSQTISASKSVRAASPNAGDNARTYSW